MSFRGLAKTERIQGIVGVVSEKENEGEDKCLASVKRIGKLKPLVDHLEVECTHSSKYQTYDVPDNLRTLLEKSTAGKPESEKGSVASLLNKYSDIFSKDEWDIVLTNLAEHPTVTGNAAPVKQRPRRVPLAFVAEEKAAIDDLLKKGVIQKSTSPWASPIVFVRKKSGAVRPCVDYRKVNALVKPDCFPLPRIQDCLDAVLE